jgi:methionine-rich copper-binding protein CopC
MNIVSRLGVICAFTVVVGGVVATPASAHAKLLKSTPTRNAHVASPEQVRLVFNDPLNPSLVKVQVRDSAGKRHESGTPEVKGGTVTDKVTGPLTPGKYVIVYRVVSADGHPVAGELSFMVIASTTDASPSPTAADPGAPATPTADVEQDSSGTTGWLWIGLGLVVILGGGFGIYRYRARPRT